MFPNLPQNHKRDDVIQYFYGYITKSEQCNLHFLLIVTEGQCAMQLTETLRMVCICPLSKLFYQPQDCLLLSPLLTHAFTTVSQSPEHCNGLCCSILRFTTEATAVRILARYTKSTYRRSVVTCDFLSAILIEIALPFVRKHLLACESSFMPTTNLGKCQKAFLLIDFSS